jgi:hypothetical protein
VVGVAGGSSGSSSVINTIIKLYAGKRFVLERGGEKFEASGYSESAVKRLVEKMTNQQAAAEEADPDRGEDNSGE